jgi:hypothetical protein
VLARSVKRSHMRLTVASWLAPESPIESLVAGSQRRSRLKLHAGRSQESRHDMTRPTATRTPPSGGMGARFGSAVMNLTQLKTWPSVVNLEGAGADLYAGLACQNGAYADTQHANGAPA